MRFLPGLVIAALLCGGCGGGDGGLDVAETCDEVRAVMPANLYDNGANATLLREIRTITAGSDQKAQRVFEPLTDRLADVVATGVDDEAFVTAGVDLLAAIDDVDEACREAGTQPLR